MLRLNFRYLTDHHTTLALLVCGLVAGIATAQQPAAQPRNAVPPVSDELRQLLLDWSRASSQIKKLHGKHERHAYDRTFGVEKRSKGEFWHEAPDKGRIDVFPVKITPAMIAKRNAPKARVERKNGKPFQLQSDDRERWICDGIRVYDIDDDQKSARIAYLPPQVRGQNIMNSPLPFLFGLPPDEALQRFNIRIVSDSRPQKPQCHLKALPRRREDAQNWSEAEIILNTSTFLPVAVKLVDPAQTKDTVYTFSDMKVNDDGIITRLLGGNPWDPKLGRDYKVHVIPAAQEQAQQNAKRAVKPSATTRPVVPNVVGQDHAVATNMLVAAGVPEANIKRLSSGPAPQDRLIYVVAAQQPPANSPLSKTDPVVLKIYDKIQAGAASPQQRAASRISNTP